MEAGRNRQRSVVVTGATGGIGTATVGRLHEVGWKVFAGIRDQGAAGRLADIGPRVTPIELDICDDASIARARGEIINRLDGHGLDGLVNLVGASVDGPLESLARESMRDQFDVNVFGHLAVTQSLLPLLRTARGRVVNVGGAAGSLTLPMFGGLSASKAALDSLTDALRMELKYQGVGVSYVEPGAVTTAFFERSRAAARARKRVSDGPVEQIYERALDTAQRATAESPKSTPEEVARAIVQALTARRPSPRYVVGRRTWLALRFLVRAPTSIRDRVVMASLGLDRTCFQMPAQLSGPIDRRDLSYGGAE
jgi:NAD(P)-dependent dehydrogenase (short-subunit alcohol dehydrogenase family)